MNAHDSERLAELLSEASARQGKDREAFLQDACAERPDLLAEVLSLLEPDTEGFLEEPAVWIEREPDAPALPESIGPYSPLRLLGEGGMGAVFLAEQRRPVRRPVAIKVIKRGMDTEQVIARFDTERQALALMNHPSIARVYDGGATADGRPYFVMEYVEGKPLPRHCDERRLGIRERLELFVQLCEGMQHAHQKGIIHRDIKGSNVLVASVDGRAIPKIIDFGIAKATDSHLTGSTVFTELGQIIGTPEYMSPEQTRLDSVDIDTRTDIYSLGVLLYVLVVGDYPFDAEALRQKGLDELLRTIREEEPLRPSARLGGMGARTGEVSEHRDSDSPTLMRRLRGDLDWIVMKAIEKDRSRRYDSAAALADDVRRYLADEPVMARPPSTAYRFSKLLRRYRGAFVAAGLVLAALVLGVIGTTTGLLRALDAEAAAEREAKASQEVAGFLMEVMGNADLADPARREAARAILESGAEKIYEQIEDEPQLRSRFMGVMGRLYRNMGYPDQARPLLERAVEINLEAPDSRNFDTFWAFNLLGTLEATERNHPRAIELFEQALRIGDEVLDADNPNLAAVMKNLGDQYAAVERFDDAREVHERGIALRERIEDPRLYASLSGLANVHKREGEHGRSVELYEQSLELRRAQFDPDARQVALGHLQLAEALRRADRSAEALSHFEQALSIMDRTYANPRHNHIRNAAFGLAACLSSLGRDSDRADAHFERALALDEHNFGPEHRYLVPTLDAFAEHLEGSGRRERGALLRTRSERIRDSD